MIAVVSLAGAKLNLVEGGDARGDGAAGSAKCQPASPDASAVGRVCNEHGGPAPEGDCPAGYFCLVAVQGRAETTCRLYCRDDCECPGGLRCQHSYCAR